MYLEASLAQTPKNEKNEKNDLYEWSVSWK